MDFDELRLLRVRLTTKLKYLISGYANVGSPRSLNCSALVGTDDLFAGANNELSNSSL